MKAIGNIHNLQFLKEAIKLVAYEVSEKMEGIAKHSIMFTSYGTGGLDGKDSKGNLILTDVNISINEDIKDELFKEFATSLSSTIENALNIKTTLKCNFDDSKRYKRKLFLNITPYEEQDFIQKFKSNNSDFFNRVIKHIKDEHLNESIEMWELFKNNYEHNPDELIKSIKEKLINVELDYSALFKKGTTQNEALAEVEKYKKLSVSRVASLALYVDDKSINKFQLFSFIKSTLKENGFDFSDLSPEKLSSSEEIEKELTKLVYSNQKGGNLLGK